MNSKKRYFITGGGTGGHIYPAMAVADVLKEMEDTEIFYVGNPNNLEYSIVQQKGYTFLPVYVKGMPRKIGFKFLWWGFKLVIARIQSLFYLN